MHWITDALKRKEGKPLLFKQNLRSSFTRLACQHFSFHAKNTRPRKTIFSGFAGTSTSLSFFVPLLSRPYSHARGHL